MELRVYFPGGQKVYADFNGFTVMTDQPTPSGAPGSAPTPFDLFLASFGTCAGVYVLGFCRQRGIDTTGLELRQKMRFHALTHQIETIDIEIHTPPGFPEKYRSAVIQAAGLCTVKRHLENPPEFHIDVVPEV